MATLTVQVNTGTDASPTWTTVDADTAEMVKVRGRGSHATFTVPNADVTDRSNLTVGRTVRIKLERGVDTAWFKGVILRPRMESVSAGVFNIKCTLGELAEKARYRTITTSVEYPQELQAVSTTEFVATDDATVAESSPTTNVGSQTTLFVTRKPTPFLENRVYLKWDISSLPGGDVILSADIRFTVDSDTDVDGDTTQSASTFVTFHNVLATWSEGTITWNNKPAIDNAADADTGVRNQLAKKEFFVNNIFYSTHTLEGLADLFRDIHAGTTTNYGIALAIADDAEDSQVELHSSEASLTTRRPRLIIKHQTGVPLSDVVTDLFTNYWSTVDITGIQATTEFVKLQLVRPSSDAATEAVEGVKFDRFDNLYDAMELLTNQVSGWEWWLDTSDGDDEVLYFEEADQGAPTGIGESDINHPFESEPENDRVINHVVVFGPTESDDVITTAIVGEARNAASQAIFGYRYKLFHEPSLASRDLLNDRAAAILHETQSEYWTIAVSVPEHRGVVPGRQVTLNLPNYGLDGVSFQQDYLIQETRDSYERGYWTRDLVLREYIT